MIRGGTVHVVIVGLIDGPGGGTVHVVIVGLIDGPGGGGGDCPCRHKSSGGVTNFGTTDLLFAWCWGLRH